MSLLAALAGRHEYLGRTALVVAHPDDETLAAGGSWAYLGDLLLIHITDGAPRHLDDAAKAGFATPEDYGQARQNELRQALNIAKQQQLPPLPPGEGRGEGNDTQGSRQAAKPLPQQERFQTENLSISDQTAALHIPEIATTLATRFDDHEITAILTHAYEGGHPDHDATCAAVQRAAAGREIVEFPAYHAAPDGSLVTARFLPGPNPVTIALTPAERSQKQAMIACFTTQAGFLTRFATAQEQFRHAPKYDFSQPPHPGRLNYEYWGWPLTGARFRTLACAV